MTHRTADHLAMTYGGETVHAASDLAIRGQALHVLTCTGRAVPAAAWAGDPSRVTCKACRKGLNNGRIEWVYGDHGSNISPEPAMTCTVHGDDACGTGLDPVGAQDCDEATPANGLVRCSCGAVVLAHLVATHAMLDHAEVAR